MPGFILALLGLVAIGRDDRIDGALDRSPVGHLAQTVRFDERTRISAAVVAEQFREQLLGDLARDDALADEIDESRQRRRTQACVRHPDALGVCLGGDVAHQPIGHCLRVALDPPCPTASSKKCAVSRSATRIEES